MVGSLGLGPFDEEWPYRVLLVVVGNGLVRTGFYFAIFHLYNHD